MIKEFSPGIPFQKVMNKKSRLKSGFALYQERDLNPHGVAPTRF